MTDIRGKDHTSPLVGTEAVPLSPDGYATTQEIANLAPGGGAGSPIVRKFPFAFDTPNLLTGAALYTPTIGDILLDAWIEIDTAWDGTTPMGDFGSLTGGFRGSGFYGWLGQGAIDMSAADVNIDGYRFGSFAPPPANRTMAFSLAGIDTGSNTITREAPGKFTTADPIKVVVSQDGTNTGDDPGSTQGAAVLFLVTATPV